MSIRADAVKGVFSFIKGHLVSAAAETGQVAKVQKVYMPTTVLEILYEVRKLNRERAILRAFRTGGHQDAAKIVASGFEKVTAERAQEARRAIADFNRYKRQGVSDFLEARRLAAVGQAQTDLEAALVRYLQAHAANSAGAARHAFSEVQAAAARLVRG